MPHALIIPSRFAQQRDYNSQSLCTDGPGTRGSLLAEASAEHEWLAVCPGSGSAVYIFSQTPEMVQSEQPYGSFDPAVDGMIPINEGDGIKQLSWSPDSMVLAAATVEGNVYTISRYLQALPEEFIQSNLTDPQIYDDILHH